MPTILLIHDHQPTRDFPARFVRDLGYEPSDELQPGHARIIYGVNSKPARVICLHGVRPADRRRGG
jgi:hypothetical protein